MKLDPTPPYWPHFFDANPYEGFSLQGRHSDVQGWGQHPILARVIEKLRPQLIVEVGTWKGASALYMAQLLSDLRVEGHIICVDTFLGSPEHFSDPALYKLMGVRNGRATLYEQFLANVILADKTHLITPLPQTSESACRILHKQGLSPDVVYIDGDHHYDSVTRDLANYWELLRPGGVLVGDDYDEVSWPGVFRAANEFAAAKKSRLYCGEGKYILDKPNPAHSANSACP